MKKKLLVIGASGLTGSKIANIASKKYDVHGTFNTRPVNLEYCTCTKLDLINTAGISNLFSELRPDFVINTSALHNVDYCQENPTQAFKINTDAVKALLENSQKYDSKLVHISTDYVFDGKKKMPYMEQDKTNPINLYGQSKLDGEKILSNTRHLIIRSSVVYGWTQLELAGVTSSSGKPMNFAMWILTKLYKKEPLKIVADQYASATLADSLADSAIKLAESDKTGLYHVSGLSCESRYEFSVKMAKEFGYDPSVIEKTDSASFKQKAKRPTFSCLNCQKAINDCGLRLLHTEESLKIMKDQVEREAPNLLQK